MVVAIAIGGLVLAVGRASDDGRRTTITSASMEPTLAVGATVRIEPLRDDGEVARGAIVVFDDPGPWRSAARSRGRSIGAADHLAKRVVGIGGDDLWCCDGEGRIVVDGVALDEPYLAPGAEASTVAFRARVPAGHLWLMGDNREESVDSRHLRRAPGAAYVPIDAVIGTVAP